MENMALSGGYLAMSRTVVLNLGAEWPFQRGYLRTPENTDITIHNSCKISYEAAKK